MTDLSSKTLSLLRRLSRLAESQPDIQTFLSEIARLSTEITGADSGAVLLLDKDAATLVVSAAYGLDEASVKQVTFQPGEGIAGRVLETGRTERFDDVIGDPQFVAVPWQEGGIHSLLVVPIRTTERVVGVMSLHGERIGAFGDPEQAWIELLARQLASDIENAWLRETSWFDPLTRILNRSRFEERLDEEIRRARRHLSDMCLLAIDIDQFHVVNEIHGEFVGDMVLREFARRVADEVRGEDILARWEGELFLCLLPHTDETQAVKAAERIRVRVMQRAFKSRRGAIPLTVSLGVAPLEPGGTTPGELVGRASGALFQAKREGRNRVAVAPPASLSGDPEGGRPSTG